MASEFTASPTLGLLAVMLLTECYASVLLKAAGCAAGEGRQLPIKGLFYGIGHQPNSSIVQGQIELDDKGYVVVSKQLLARTPNQHRLKVPAAQADRLRN